MCTFLRHVERAACVWDSVLCGCFVLVRERIIVFVRACVCFFRTWGTFSLFSHPHQLGGNIGVCVFSRPRSPSPGLALFTFVA